jgi:hypothetical protein
MQTEVDMLSNPDQCACGDPDGVDDDECETCAYEAEEEYRRDVLAQVGGY